MVFLIFIYFLFRVGIRLYKKDLYGYTFWAWLLTGVGVITGLNLLNEDNPIGFVGFIPIMTYIVLNILSAISIEYSTQKKIKSTIFSGVASAATYYITHTMFGFGIPEASFSAVVAASILGIVGYNA